jgi:uncharacterized repeat protein (TIGR03806 family)
VAFTGFTEPLALVESPTEEGRWYVLEKGGTIQTFLESDPVATRTTFATLTVSTASEQGLLGMAFHPDYAANDQVFLSYTNGGGASVISRFAGTSSGTALDTGSEEVLLTVSQPAANHNGGHIAFGADGFLYIGLGDGGGSDDVFGNGQNINTLLGAMLRIDVDNGTPYATPPDNPFVGVSGRDEIYAWGFRNPWKFSFDSATGELWVGDVGQDTWEEIDLVKRGGNYGWDDMEGAHCFNTDPCFDIGHELPVVEHAQPDAQSITGGYVYRGAAIPEMVGVYIYGDYITGTIWALYFDDDGNPTPQVLVSSPQNISSFGQGTDGEVYVVGYGGTIYKIGPTGAPAPNTFPQLLSETGCFDAEDLTQPASGVIPFGLISPLWSDGAGKGRFLAIPDGTTIAVEADGDWTFPVGSIIIKNFGLEADKLFETRLLIRHDDGEWAGYTYEWNDAGTDADLLPAGKAKEVAGQPWLYPSRQQCLRCHTTAAGRTIGPETAQLNRLFAYPDGRIANQLETLDYIGLLAGLPDTPAALPEVTGSGTAQARAKSYLHINCSGCHRPGGPVGVGMDLRYETPLYGMGICDMAPVRGELGLTDPALLSPGQPTRSVMLERMKRTDVHRMPPLGTALVDDTGVGVVQEWIESLSVCP